MSSRDSLTVDQVRQIIAKSESSKDAVEVVNFDLQPFSKRILGFLAIHELLTVKISTDSRSNTTKTLTFFVKHSLKLGDHNTASAFDEEAKFYADVAPQLAQFNVSSEPWLPKCYLVVKNFLVLENLKAVGFAVPKSSLETEQLKCALATLAHLHSSSMMLEKKLNKPLNKVYPGFFRDSKSFASTGTLGAWSSTSLEVADAVLTGLNLKSDKLKEAFQSANEKSKLVEERGQTNVLCLIDSWFNNFMFHKDNPNCCRMLDYQLVIYTSYAVDLARFLHLNLDRSSRARLTDELLKIYHSTLIDDLRSNGYEEVARSISLEKITEEVESKKLCGLVVAVQHFPVILMSEKWAKELAEDKEKNFFVSRKDIVLRAMRDDAAYRARIEDVVKELVEFVQEDQSNNGD